MKVKILGIGGFGNTGLPFNSFLIDGHILVDAPPDILQSLKREAVDIEDIDSVVITHYHGDHFFGLPFLLFQYYERREAWSRRASAGKRFMIAGPAGLAEKLREILALAISPGHPYIGWCFDELALREIDGASRLTWPGGAWMEFRRSAHSVETYSILSGDEHRGDTPRFISTSDTQWDPALERLAAAHPSVLLCDCNGEGYGGVHMSPDEVALHILPLLGPGTEAVGTHFSREMTETDRQYPCGRVHFASCGELFEL